MIDTNRLLSDKKYCEEAFKFLFKKGIIKKVNPSSFKKHIDKSTNNLEFANYILNEHDFSIKQKLKGKKFYDWCITIYYYSLYHCALALVFKVGFETKSHLATITTLTLFYYHKDNILKREEIEFLINSFPINKNDIDLILNTKELRERASYGVEAFNQKQAEDLRINVVDFVNKCRSILEE